MVCEVSLFSSFFLYKHMILLIVFMKDHHSDIILMFENFHEHNFSLKTLRHMIKIFLFSSSSSSNTNNYNDWTLYHLLASPLAILILLTSIWSKVDTSLKTSIDQPVAIGEMIMKWELPWMTMASQMSFTAGAHSREGHLMIAQNPQNTKTQNPWVTQH